MAKRNKDDPCKTDQNGSIEDRRENVAVMLAAGQTVSASARACGVGRTTVTEWRKDASFNARVAELRKDLTDAAVGRLAQMMAGTAADALEALLKIKGENRIKLDAVRTVFELFGGVTSNLELREVLEELQTKKGDQS